MHFERSRVLKYISKYDVLVDVFCGVGPFSCRAVKEKQCIVYANDLNPFCYEYLLKNKKQNHLENLHCFNLDGRIFIKNI